MIPTHSGAPGTDAPRAEVSTKGAGATHRPHIGEVLAYTSSINAIPIGGRLFNFGDRWLRLTTVPWIRDLFTYGYTIEFWATPSDRFHPSPCPRAPARHNIMQTAIHHLLHIAAIEPVPTTERSEGVYSLLFAVPKRDLSWRAVLDLKFVNRFVTYRRFKMESLHSITESLHEGDFLASIDLKEAYLHVPICIAHRKFLRFTFGHQHFQYRAMPFGLSSAPRVFSKVLLILVAYLRTQGVHIYPYLDDLLIRAKSEELAHHHLMITLNVLQTYGWLVNFDKSHLQPTQRLLHLGAMLDTLQAMVFLSPDRITAITSIARSLMQQTSADVMLLSRTLGMFISTIHIVPWARAHTRPLQWTLLPFQKDIASSNHRKVRLSPALRLSFRWWTKVQHLSKGTSFREPRRTVVTTDASLIGWGAHCNSQYVQGVWPNAERSRSINWLELKAVHLALCHFQSLFPLHHVLIRTDNTCVKSHLNRQGGTRSRPLQDLASLIFVWAEQHLQSLKAEHLRGILNVTADWLSRQQVFPGEWKLHPAIFHRLQCRFGALSVDLFASSHNCQLPRYFARYLDSTAEAVDALTTPWPDGLLYAFPPIPLLAKTLRKARIERAQLVLVAPFWPRRPWFSDLLAMSMMDSWTLPVTPDLLSQGPVLHQDPTWLNLTAWRLNGDT
ncbi:uncharacterized protein LOC133383498 isoform X1 [Rhineura floridana]|uniref:uncharacterized protein LOC133383498 isoform X1 n=1 Tax=Rhineura floridana TaxID=261503 RepID=UPI002AC82184|nr:uncharacterized protein LOC133383498 isoform X1 [Rhineura floridana]